MVKSKNDNLINNKMNQNNQFNINMNINNKNIISNKFNMNINNNINNMNWNMNNQNANIMNNNFNNNNLFINQNNNNFRNQEKSKKKGTIIFIRFTFEKIKSRYIQMLLMANHSKTYYISQKINIIGYVRL